MSGFSFFVSHGNSPWVVIVCPLEGFLLDYVFDLFFGFFFFFLVLLVVLLFSRFSGIWNLAYYTPPTYFPVSETLLFSVQLILLHHVVFTINLVNNKMYYSQFFWQWNMQMLISSAGAWCKSLILSMVSFYWFWTWMRCWAYIFSRCIRLHTLTLKWSLCTYTG